MHIVIPLGGKGERMAHLGAKPLIQVHHKTVIAHLLDNIQKQLPDASVIIIYNPALDDHNFASYIKSHYPNISLIKLPRQTRGPVETILLGLADLSLTGPVLLLDGDTFYTDLSVLGDNGANNVVYYRHNTDKEPLYSYIELASESTKITKIVEKCKISDCANTGAYKFASCELLLNYCQRILEQGVSYKGEPYTSCVIAEMLTDGIPFDGQQVDHKTVFSLGTPSELQVYLDYCQVFLFDLDGTLVLTDDIYYDVWQTILTTYGVDLTPEIFNNYIRGNNDKHVVDVLLSHTLGVVDVSEISTQKDTLFSQNITKITQIKGAKQALHRICSLGHKVAIVTNCNRTVAELIVQHLAIHEYVDFIISSSDCVNGKPHPEPYCKAIERYGVTSNKVLIFEDSKTGILSARSVGPSFLVGVTTNYDCSTLKDLGAHHCISDYDNFDPLSLTSRCQDGIIYRIQKAVSVSLSVPSCDVKVDNTRLKGGFISDVLRVHIKPEKEYILKIESTAQTMLSDMANQLELYEREYYFYETISNQVSIRVPKYIALVHDADDADGADGADDADDADSDKKKPIGILLENLNTVSPRRELNLNLGNAPVEVSLKIIERMATLHAQFWGKTSAYPGLKTPLSNCFRPFCSDFVKERWPAFAARWTGVLTPAQLTIGDNIVNQFADIQMYMASGATTLVHGDIKSPNIFYEIDNDNEPIFLDWQHTAVGKGVQDLVFFLIESFSLEAIMRVQSQFKTHYYSTLTKLIGEEYTQENYDKDFNQALCYIPIFTAVWFGTVPDDQLIDKDFPHVFIKKLFALLLVYLNIL